MSFDLPNRWADYLRRLFNTRGSTRVTGSDEVLPVVNLTEEGLHLRSLRGEYAFMYSGVCPAAGAGQYSLVQLFGPSSGGFVVVERLTIFKLAAGYINVETVTLAPSIPGARTARHLDTRCGATLPGALGALDSSAPGYTANTEAVQVAGATTTVYLGFDGVVIGPPQDTGNVIVLQLQSQTVNESFNYTIHGTYHPLHGGEDLGQS